MTSKTYEQKTTHNPSFYAENPDFKDIKTVFKELILEANKLIKKLKEQK